MSLDFRGLNARERRNAVASKVIDYILETFDELSPAVVVSLLAMAHSVGMCLDQTRRTSNTILNWWKEYRDSIKLELEEAGFRVLTLTHDGVIIGERSVETLREHIAVHFGFADDVSRGSAKKVVQGGRLATCGIIVLDPDKKRNENCPEIVGPLKARLKELDGRKDRLEDRINKTVETGILTLEHKADLIGASIAMSGGTARIEAADDAVEIEVFACPQCGEQFDQEVWHCEKCNHHWLPADTPCRNCNDVVIDV